MNTLGLTLHFAFYLFWIYEKIETLKIIDELGLELLYDVTEYNYCLVDEFNLQVYVGRQLDDCITACALRPHCKALAYHPQFGSTSLCELYQNEGNKHVGRTGCVYIQRQDITIDKIPCATECRNGSTCNKITKQCDYTECISFPKITNGTILGNGRSIGNKLRFKCDTGRSIEKETVCQADGKWSVSSVNCKQPKDCKDIFDTGARYNGVDRIFQVGSGNDGILVRCDMTTPPGGWTIIQRRIDDRDFYKTWYEYKAGFGDVFGSYWLGNDLIWKLTSSKKYRLRIDLTAQDGMTGYAEYDHFSIEAERSQYAINIGGFHGNVSDSLAYHNHMKFSTKDRDNDVWYANCAVYYHGAWWYKDCHASNLNGDYMNSERAKGINWFRWRGYYESLKNTEMKIHPEN